MEENTVRKLKVLLTRYCLIPERLEECKVLIGQLGEKSAKKIIFKNDCIDLYLYILEKYNLILTEEDLGKALDGYPRNWHTRTSRRDSIKIIEFILHKHPETATYSNLHKLMNTESPLLIKRVSEIVFILYPKLVNLFKTISQVYKRNNLPNEYREILKLLIAKGFRPEYYSPGLNILTLKSFQSNNFVVDWNGLPKGEFIITDTIQAKVKCKIDDYVIADIVEGNCNLILEWLEKETTNIVDNIRRIDKYVDIYSHPIFDQLRELPSLQTISKNVMVASGIIINNSSPLRTVVIGF